MRFLFLPICVLIPAVFAQAPQAQESKPAEDSLARVEGMPPRASAADYASQAKAGDISIGAEFSGHSVPTPDGILKTEEFIVIEAGFFGAPGAKLQLAQTDFSLRINGNKKALASEPFGSVISNVTDPDWAPPDASKKAGGIAGLTANANGGGPPADNGPTSAPKPPFEVKRKLELRVKKISMPEGERPLPQAGLLYFRYRAKEKGIHSLELIYSGAAGSAVVNLHP
jgi:hypothetical protein